jgi:hypothetical protein
VYEYFLGNQMETRKTRNQMETPGTEDLNNNRYAINSRDVSHSCLQALQQQKEHRQQLSHQQQQSKQKKHHGQYCNISRDASSSRDE